MHLKNACSRVCECSWNMGGRVSTQVASYDMADECTDVTTIEELTTLGGEWCTRRTLH